MNQTLAASSPNQNAVVFASAGTGKTWLLVTRLLRLLIEGVPPDSILAITFTRKAAAEMQTRLFERLFKLATLENELLVTILASMDIPTSDEFIQRARGAYEKLIYSEQPIRITTFHAFCNDILKRFPIEANVPPGFDLLENNGLLEQEAHDALFGEATSHPDSELGQALDTLLTQYGSIFVLNDALDEFMRHRADWSIFTRLHSEPVHYACTKLAAQLQIDKLSDPYLDFFNAGVQDNLREFIALLERHPTQTNQRAVLAISAALDTNHSTEERIKFVKNAFLTKQGNPLARKQSKIQEKTLGHTGELHFLMIHQAFCDRLSTIQEHERRIFTYSTSRAWYIAGEKLLGHYQRIKHEQRLLDFVDLELRVYDLLNHSNNAHWVQYKLDQRIDHLLVDEFQDTNPTQWRMILPLLHELAAGQHSHSRSVFLVGDSKQSIYRFRRANPRLIKTAHNWLEKHLDAQQYSLDVSWRSSTAIIDFINKVFTKGTLKERLPSFQIHDTRLHNLWGKVEVMPLIDAAKSAQQDSTPIFRNSLDIPRIIDEDQRHYEEGKLIASRIKELIQNHIVIVQDSISRLLTYNDIIILVRNRTHMPSYEKALRDNLVPYQSAGKTTLLDSLEIQDIVALLETLITPYNNLSLATVLRSPLFECSDNDLMLIASYTNSETGSDGHRNAPWIERISKMAPALEADSPIKRASHWLTGWRTFAGQLPVHDLLDRIYSEGNVFARYQAAFPEHLQQRVTANLSRFIELALEVDSGRYPSLPFFLSRLRSLRQYAQNALEEPPPTSNNSVRLMTIHAAKGLEATAIFLADTTRSNTTSHTYKAMITWPEDSEQPDNFFLAGKKSEMDQWSRTLLERAEYEELQEEANLLYVALSRAKQLLFISGCAPARNNALGWYGMIAENLTDDITQVINNGYVHKSGNPLPRTFYKPSIETTQIVKPHPGLAQPLYQPQDIDELDITPSHITGHFLESVTTTTNDNGDDAILRGNVIHRFLALLTERQPISDQILSQQVANEYMLDRDDQTFNDWWQEACRLIHQPEFNIYFDPAHYISAYNEVPIQYYADDKLVHGIIDRLIVNDGSIIVIDYKTNPHATLGNLSILAKPYYDQMRLYRNGVQKIWSGKPVRSILLFTACAEAYELNEGTIFETTDSGKQDIL